MASLLASTALAALRKWWGPVLGHWAVAVNVIELCSSVLAGTAAKAIDCFQHPKATYSQSCLLRLAPR